MDTWKKRLIDIGVPESEVNQLRPYYDFITGNSDSKMKLLTIILNEYRKSWDDYASWITRRLSNPQFMIEQMSSQNLEYVNRLRFNGFNWQFLDDTQEWINVNLGLGSLDSSNHILRDMQSSFVLPCHNNLFTKYIDEIESSIIRLLTDKPDDNSVKSVWEYIIQNWFYL